MFIANPRWLLCFGIAWIITNGWSYVFLALGQILHLTWMTAVGGGYLAFLWFPFTPEKLLTIAIALGLLRLLFPKDEKTLGVLKSMHDAAKKGLKNKKQRKNDTKGPKQ